MIERPVGYVALSAPFLGVALELLPHFPGAQVAVASAAAGAFAVGCLTFVQRHAVGLPNVVLAVALVATAVAVALTPGVFGPYGPAILVGFLVGGPWVLSGYVARPESALGIRFVAFSVATLWGLFLLANASSAVGSGPSTIASAYVTHFFSLVGQQFQVFGGLLSGAASPPLPLNLFFDPLYTALVAVALVGLLLVSVRPQTGARAPLPVAVRTYRSVDSERDVGGTYGFTPAQRGVFRERSVGETPLATWPPGIEPVFVGAAAAGAFLVASYFVPTWTVAATVASVAIAALWLIRTTVRPLDPGVAGTAPPRPAAGPPAEPPESNVDRAPPDPSPRATDPSGPAPGNAS